MDGTVDPESVILFHEVVTLAVNDLDKAPGAGRPSDVLLDLIDQQCQRIRDEQPLMPPERRFSAERLEDLETQRKHFREGIWQLREGFGPVEQSEEQKMPNGFNPSDMPETAQDQLDFLAGFVAGLSNTVYLIIEALEVEARAEVITLLRKRPAPDVGTPPYAAGYDAARKAVDGRLEE